MLSSGKEAIFSELSGVDAHYLSCGNHGKPSVSGEGVTSLLCRGGSQYLMDGSYCFITCAGVVTKQSSRRQLSRVELRF
jgi:hypothetical protein